MFYLDFLGVSYPVLDFERFVFVGSGHSRLGFGCLESMIKTKVPLNLF